MSSEAESHQTPIEVPDHPGLLVEPAWLREKLDVPGLRIVDLRDPEAHASGHIPGAVHLDLSELGRSVGGCDSVLVAPEEFSRLIADRGISNEDTIVAYDDQWGLAAARLVWALAYYGHVEAAVLNGGWDRWGDESGPTVSGEERHAPGRFEATVRADVSADTDRILRSIEAGEALLLDSRSPAEFEKGHLPGAVSWDWFNAVPAGSWDVSRDPEKLRAEWRELGLVPSHEIIVYCGSGMRAAHTWLVMRNAGFPRVRLYDGSWQEWSMKVGEMDGD